MAGDVILGYDGSEGSRAALAVAVAVARAFDAPLTVVFGYEPNPMGGETADYKRKLEKIGSDLVATAAAEAKKLDAAVRVEPLVVALRPAESLIEAARSAPPGSSSSGAVGSAPSWAPSSGRFPTGCCTAPTCRSWWSPPPRSRR